jgi:hypothetical protein
MGIILRTQKMAAGHAAAAFINIASFFVLRHAFFAETFSTVSVKWMIADAVKDRRSARG